MTKKFYIGIAALLLASPLLAEDFKIDDWTHAFRMLGSASGKYDACTHRDLISGFDDFAEKLAAAFSDAQDGAAISLSDSARMSYFAGLGVPCDPSRIDLMRHDISTWRETINQAISKGKS